MQNLCSRVFRWSFEKREREAEGCGRESKHPARSAHECRSEPQAAPGSFIPMDVGNFC